MSKLNVYQINSHDWVAAESLEEAIDFFKETMGDDDLVENPRQLLGQEMNTLRVVDDEISSDYDDEDFPTFRDELDNRIKAGESFPQIFFSNWG